MIATASNSKKTSIMLTITLILLVTITSVLVSSFSQSSSNPNSETTIDQPPKESPLPLSLTAINETNNFSVTNSSNNYSSGILSSVPISLDAQKLSSYREYSIQQLDLTQFLFSFPDSTNQGQIAESDPTLPLIITSNNETGRLDEANSTYSYSPTPPNTFPISLDTSKFEVYTYGGYSVQQPDLNQFLFSLPENTNQGQIAGSDAISLDTYIIQKIDFDVTFNAPKIGATGFDEMVIFAASNTTTYKGTELGIRLDLSDGFIYGYIQEPTGDFGDVNFQMQELTPNDGTIHHYTLIMLGSQVSVYLDGINYGYLNYPSNEDYSSLNFSICAVVHKFTDDWDSNGDTMIVENFFLNQQ